MTARVFPRCIVDGCQYTVKVAKGRIASSMCAGHEKRKQRWGDARLVKCLYCPVLIESPLLHEGDRQCDTCYALHCSVCRACGDAFHRGGVRVVRCPKCRAIRAAAFHCQVTSRVAL